jgi:hypothetical protein
MSLLDKLKGRNENPIKAAEVVRAAAVRPVPDSGDSDPGRDGLDRFAWFLDRDVMGAGKRKTAKDWGLYDFIHKRDALERRRRYLRLINDTVEGLSAASLRDTSSDIRLSLVCDAVTREFNRFDKGDFETFVNKDRGIAEALQGDPMWARLEEVVQMMILADYAEARRHPNWLDNARAA